MTSAPRFYEYELTGVSDERLRDVIRNFRAEGAVETETIPEPGGLWTVRAKFESSHLGAQSKKTR